MIRPGSCAWQWQKRPAAAPREVEPRSRIEVSATRSNVTSAAFWELMARWKVADLTALDLIGHSAGLSKKGTRPRFKLAGEESEMVKLLFEIDEAVARQGLDPHAWVNKSLQAPPFEGTSPISYLTRNRLKGVKATSQYLLKNGLRLSMGASSRPIN